EEIQDPRDAGRARLHRGEDRNEPEEAHQANGQRRQVQEGGAGTIGQASDEEAQRQIKASNRLDQDARKRYLSSSSRPDSLIDYRSPIIAVPAITRGFAWARRSLAGESAIAYVTRQGVWALVGLVAVSVLGFGFWALAARLFSHDAVGIVASLVSLSTFGAALAILGFDTGILRFASRELHPRRLIRTILLVTGFLAAGVGLVIALVVLTINHVNGGLLWPLAGLSLALTVWTVWGFATNGALIAAGKAQFASLQLLLYGVLKIVFLVAFVSVGIVGLFAAYALPLLPIILFGFLLIRRYWPAKNPQGTAHPLREVAALSAGNWISYSGYSVPNLLGPALILTFFDASTAAYFFLAFQLAEILNYGAEAL